VAATGADDVVETAAAVILIRHGAALAAFPRRHTPLQVLAASKDAFMCNVRDEQLGIEMLQ
jgi:hypothetical protein